MLMKLGFSLNNFRNQPQIIKIHENPSSASPVLSCGRTDGHDEADSRSSQLCARALQPDIFVGTAARHSQGRV